MFQLNKSNTFDLAESFGWKYINNRLNLPWNLSNLSSPSFLFDPQRLQKNLDLWTSLRKQDSRVSLFYALKANYLPDVLHIIRENSFGVEVMSNFEYLIARDCQFKNQNIIFNGPGKSDEDLQNGVENGIQLNIDSIEELVDLIAIIQSLKIKEKIPIFLRIHPQLPVEIERKCFIHQKSKLGVDPDRALSFFRKQKDLPIELKGIHCHVGTSQTDLDLLKHVLIFLEKLSLSFREIGQEIKSWNVGGGFESPSLIEYHSKESFSSFIEGISNLFSNYDINEIQMEPGRSLVGDTCYILSSIQRVKKSFGATWAILDVGVNILIPLKYSSFLPIPLFFPGDETSVDSKIAGPWCMPVDVINAQFSYPVLKKQQFLIMNCGAYTQSMEEHFGGSLLPVFSLSSDAIEKISRLSYDRL